MRKRIALLLIVCLLAACCTAFAADETETKRAADALYLLGLFKGTNNGYELDKFLTREQGVTMLIRAMGNESKTAAYADKCLFEDVDDWAKGYVGFAFENGITMGVSETKFGYGAELTDAMFLTMLLRALGYEEGEDKEFVWDDPYELAKSVSLIDYDTADESFLRGDMVLVIYRLLDCKFKSGEGTVADALMKDNVFTQESYDNAKKICEGSAKLEDFQPQGQGDDPGIFIPVPGGIGGTTAASSSGSSGGSSGSQTESVPTHETPDVDPTVVGG